MEQSSIMTTGAIKAHGMESTPATKDLTSAEAVDGHSELAVEWAAWTIVRWIEYYYLLKKEREYREREEEEYAEWVRWSSMTPAQQRAEMAAEEEEMAREERRLQELQDDAERSVWESCEYYRMWGRCNCH